MPDIDAPNRKVLSKGFGKNCEAFIDNQEYAVDKNDDGDGVIVKSLVGLSYAYSNIEIEVRGYLSLEAAWNFTDTRVSTLTLYSDLTIPADGYEILYSYTSESDSDRTESAVVDRLYVSEFRTLCLNLNGHTIDRALTHSKQSGCVIEVNGGMLTLEDGAGTGKLTGGNNTSDGGGIVVLNGGTFIFESGTICQNSAVKGGGVYVADGSTMRMTGGKITENTAHNTAADCISLRTATCLYGMRHT